MTVSDAAAAREVGRMWWLWLVAGILWILIALVILQMDGASATTVGIIIGVMLMVAGIQYIFVGTIAEGWKWLWYVFGAVLLIAGLVALFNPTRTVAAIADILGFIFALIGILWIIEAFSSKDVNDLWWLSLIAGILMIALGFWLGGQFLITKVYTLLVFTGIWALMKGIIDIVTAFQVKKLGKISVDM